MGQCFSCLDEDAKVEKILRKFNAKPARQAVDCMLQKVVGRVVAAGPQQSMLYAPASGKPCVYFCITIEEEIKVTEYDDESGATSSRIEWETVCTDEQFRDFYIQDGNAKLFVNGGNRSKVKISSEEEDDDNAGGWFTTKLPPAGVRSLVGCRRPDYVWYADTDHDGDVETRQRTGELRWAEKSFDLNEIVAAMGVPVQSVDPYTHAPGRVLQVFTEEVLTDAFFEQQGWSDFEKKSWHSMLKDGPVVLVSDKEEFTEGIDVQPIMQLPVYMTQPLSVVSPALYQVPPAPIVVQPVVVTNYVMPGPPGQVVATAPAAPLKAVPTAPGQVVAAAVGLP